MSGFCPALSRSVDQGMKNQPKVCVLTEVFPDLLQLSIPTNRRRTAAFSNRKCKRASFCHRFPRKIDRTSQKNGNVFGALRKITTLVGRRFANQCFADSRELICFADSRESIRANRFEKRLPIFEALGQIRANRVFSPIRIEIRVIRVQSSLLSHFCKVDSQKQGFFYSKRESIRANRPTKNRKITTLPCFQVAEFSGR